MKLRKAAEKLLLAHLKKHALENLQNGQQPGAQNIAPAPQEVPSVPHKVIYPFPNTHDQCHDALELLTSKILSLTCIIHRHVRVLTFLSLQAWNSFIHAIRIIAAIHSTMLKALVTGVSSWNSLVAFWPEFCQE